VPDQSTAKPLISVDAIFTRALELLDAEGAGLSTRDGWPGN
jgi:hypothetical protein